MRKQRLDRKGIVIGITGSFGSGKSTAAGEFRSFGAKVIDADRIAHSLIRPGTKIYKRLICAFGKGILKTDKTIDRDKLSRMVFNKEILLRRLDGLMHPEVIRIIKREIRNSPSRVIVLDVPLLIESGLLKLVDKLIVVKINRAKQIERIIKKTSLSRGDILKRIKHQIPLPKKVRLADFVIDNNGTVNNTRRQVIKIWKIINPVKTGAH